MGIVEFWSILEALGNTAAMVSGVELWDSCISGAVLRDKSNRARYSDWHAKTFVSISYKLNNHYLEFSAHLERAIPIYKTFMGGFICFVCHSFNSFCHCSSTSIFSWG